MVTSLLYQFRWNGMNGFEVMAYNLLANQMAHVKWPKNLSQARLYGNESAVSILWESDKQFWRYRLEAIS